MPMPIPNPADLPMGPALPNVDPCQALTLLHAAAHWRQLSILRGALIDDLVRERDLLKTTLQQVSTVLQEENARPNGAIVDTIWNGPWETLFETIDGALQCEGAFPAECFQDRVLEWLVKCFGPRVAGDTLERQHRFFEEAGELVQACGMTASEAHQLVDYTWGRPAGQPAQEVGGVLLTLAGLCSAKGLDMAVAGETELARVNSSPLMDTIRTKQAAKPKDSPLPGVSTSTLYSTRGTTDA